ncbi:hybrid sensor histidine kinase/response regulator transcription factor [Poritiphilus flavus]|uniref:histidine kinase n=1 Tax=Poritiphilus flavus TaxID=2697053 RepID=A0A6L9EIA8_9FLAO|nr:response regulator [Poritiphilus flavus]NAS14396.1 response regulator [Poritiphilus flavus]
MRVLFGVLCSMLSLSIPVNAQTERIEDSVRTARLYSEFDSIIHSDAKVAKQYIDSLELLAQRSHYRKALYFYQSSQAYYLFVKSKLPASMRLYEKALETARTLNMDKEWVKTRIWVGNHHFFNNKREQARSAYEEALATSKKINFPDGIANAYFGLASLKDEGDQVMRYLLQIDSMYTANKSSSPILANALGHIGKLYFESDNHLMAKSYLKKSIKVAKENNYIPGIIGFKIFLGDIAVKEDSLDLARTYYRSALHGKADQNDSINLAHAMVNLGELEYKLGKLAKAEEYLIQGLETFQKYDDFVNTTFASLMLSELYSAKGNRPQAQKYLDYARDNPKYLSEAKYQLRLLQSEIQFHEQFGEFHQAYLKQKKLDSLRADQIGKQNAEAFMALEQEHNAAKKEQEIALLKTENALAAQQKRNQLNLLLAGMGILSVVGLFFFFLFRNRQKTAQKLRELDRVKSDFFANISHEFRTPLTLISGPLQQKLENNSLGPAEREELMLMQRNSQRLLRLVDQLLALSKLESGSYQLRVGQGDLGSLLGSIAESFRFPAKQNKIQYEVNVTSMDSCWFDRDLIEKVTVNLLSNALKYSPVSGSVQLKASQKGKFLRLDVENTTGDLDEKNLEMLFSRFYQADHRAEGAGIGLALVKELVELAHGKIKLKLKKDGKLRFRVRLPLAKKYFRSEEISEDVILPQNPIPELVSHKAGEVTEAGTSEEKPILLVVEDNADVRQFVKKSFSGDFKVLEAENGVDGQHKAVESIPDIIISDIMMPEMDGLELCALLKQDERTSHIPVILLTARAGEEDQYKGLENGADDYVTKPFKLKLLRSRVHNLISSRKLLRQRYSQEIVLKPRDIAITNLDEQFLSRVQEVLDVNLTNPVFTVKEFSEHMGMSRMQLHRKLKALTGFATSEFIRSQRLKMAVTLLEKSDVSISEIAYQVGFNDPSYFAKCFKEAYGCSPKAYLYA